MLAYKFLRAGAVAPVSSFAWPAPAGSEPGDWIEASGPLEPCANGVHACRMAGLPTWIGDELWAVELGGEIVEFEGVLVARRGRLLSRMQGWNSDTSVEFARACAARAGERAARDAGLEGYAVDAA